MRFAEEAFGDGLKDTILLFERMRRNRHISVYDTPGTISEVQAKNTINHAGKLLEAVEEKLEPELKSEFIEKMEARQKEKTAKVKDRSIN